MRNDICINDLDEPMTERTRKNVMKIIEKAKFLCQLADGSLAFIPYKDLHYVQTNIEDFIECSLSHLKLRANEGE
jgi:hypothetical protein